MHFIYVLFSEKYNRHYTGLTCNIEKRLHEHNSGQNKSTKPYRPWKLIHSEPFQTRSSSKRKIL
ncbi:MAG: GIY-YIG nuclease family protein [Bacteroidales bacterium]